MAISPLTASDAESGDVPQATLLSYLDQSSAAAFLTTQPPDLMSPYDGGTPNASTAHRGDNDTLRIYPPESIILHAAASTRHLTQLEQGLITFFYIFGMSSNVCALILISRSQTARNRKQTLMMRCLACNDFLALVGSFLLMHMQLYMDQSLVSSQWFCALRVVLRTFGFSSGCVTIVMAVERWLALTHPFVYQKHVTYKLIKRAIFTLWVMVIVLVCLPFFGFGLYYEHDHSPGQCLRYRFAVHPKDVAYAYVVFAFGTILCAVILICNMAVVRVLCRLGKRCMARMGRTTIRKDSKELSFNHTTPDELCFAKLMVILCIFFIACWLPQMITIVFAQVSGLREHPFYRIADMCVALNFTLDPVIYVLSRQPHRKGLRTLLKPICQTCWPQHNRDGSLQSNTQGTVMAYKLVANAAMLYRAKQNVSRSAEHVQLTQQWISRQRKHENGAPRAAETDEDSAKVANSPAGSAVTGNIKTAISHPECITTETTVETAEHSPYRTDRTKTLITTMKNHNKLPTTAETSFPKDVHPINFKDAENLPMKSALKTGHFLTSVDSSRSSRYVHFTLANR